MFHCLLSIGSNYHRKENLAFAQQRLEVLFPAIRFSRELETKPLNMKNPALFSNQVAEIVTGMRQEEITRHLKTIEQEAGRTAEGKAREIICLDIDLLTYNNRVLKPDDMSRDYIREGINDLALINKIP